MHGHRHTHTLAPMQPCFVASFLSGRSCREGCLGSASLGFHVQNLLTGPAQLRGNPSSPRGHWGLRTDVKTRNKIKQHREPKGTIIKIIIGLESIELLELDKRKVKKTLSTDLKILLKTMKRRASDCLGPLKTRGGGANELRKSPQTRGDAGSKVRCQQYSRALERVPSSNDLSVTECADRSPNPRLPNNQTAGSV